MAGFCLVEDVRAKNRLLRESSGWTDAQMQSRIDEVTCAILSQLRERFPAQLTASDWLADPPATVPKQIRFICINLVVGKCLMDAYGEDDKLSQQGQMQYFAAMTELTALARDAVILQVDGFSIEGQPDLISVAPIVEDENTQDYTSDDLNDWG